MSPFPPRAILHVDMDAFYASVEQRDEPSLRGKPVLVGGAGPRGVVAAASYESRVYGIRSAMPMREALTRCPHAVCVPPRFDSYRRESACIFAIFHGFSPLVESLSLDEAFIDVTASRSLFGDAAAIGRAIKDRIRDATRLSASVGIGPNKLVAKIASDLDKPDGLRLVDDDSLQSTLDPLPARVLPGVGPRAAGHLRRIGLTTLGELRRAPASRLQPIFGRYSEQIRQRAAGVDDRPVVPDAARKSISAEETFDADLPQGPELSRELARLADRTAARLRASGLVAGCVCVKIRRPDFATFTRRRSLHPPASGSRLIHGAARELLGQWFAAAPDAKLRLLGVGVEDLEPAGQADLLAALGTAGNDAIDDAVDRIRARFGEAALGSARTLR
ncbi:MAG: DNA polymerase IV [Gammaproteobacteria bacterium]